MPRHAAVMLGLLSAGCSSAASRTTTAKDAGLDATRGVADSGRDSGPAKRDASADVGKGSDAGAVLGAVTVTNGQLCRDGECGWRPKGMIFVAFVCPPTDTKCDAQYTKARAAFGSDAGDLGTAIDTFKLDTIRFNFSQDGLDPTSTADGGLYSKAYREAAVMAVTDARARGMSVIVTMQDETSAGPETDAGNVPTAQTQRSWKELLSNSTIGDDPGVMLEIFNEPGEKYTPGGASAAWAAWQSEEAPLAASIRALGAKNVLIVDGLSSSHVLEGEPSLGDAGPLAYAVHGFPFKDNVIDYTTAAGWDAYFGGFCADGGHPCVVDAWYTGPSDEAAVCFPHGGSTVTSADLTQSFLQYLAGHSMGLVGFAYDIPRYFVTTLGGSTPTSFAAFTSCDAGGGGPGAMTAAYFADGSTQIR